MYHENKRLSTEYFIKLLKSLYKWFDFEKGKRYDLKYFDSSMIYDKIRKVNEESTGDPSVIMTLTNFIQSFSSLIGTITVLASLNVGIMLLCILFAYQH